MRVDSFDLGTFDLGSIAMQFDNGLPAWDWLPWAPADALPVPARMAQPDAHRAIRKPVANLTFLAASRSSRSALILPSRDDAPLPRFVVSSGRQDIVCK